MSSGSKRKHVSFNDQTEVMDDRQIVKGDFYQTNAAYNVGDQTVRDTLKNKIKFIVLSHQVMFHLFQNTTEKL